MDALSTWIDDHRWAALTIGVLLLSLYLTAGTLWPRFQATMTLYDAWQDNEDKLRSVTQWPVDQVRLQVRRRRLEKRFERLYVSLPRSDQMSIILETLQQNAHRSGVAIKQIRPGQRVAHATYDHVPFEMELRGTFHALCRFAHYVEQSRFLMKVDVLSIRSEPRRSASTTAPIPALSAALTIHVSILKQHASAHE